MAYPFKTKPYKHQIEEFERHRDDAARALVWSMRTGKSKAMVDLACYHASKLDDHVDGVLVVAPSNVHLNWFRRELPFHHWDTVPHSKFVWQASKSHNVRFDFAFDRFLESKDLAWYLVNCEALADERAKRYVSRFLRSRRRLMLIVDESHEFRRPGSKRSHAIRALAPKAAVRRILSANPLDNDPLHAFAQYEILQPGALGYATYAEFEAAFGVKEEIYVPGGRRKDGTQRKPRKQWAVTGYRDLDVLRERIARWTGLVTRDEVDDMPELVRQPRLFELHPEQKRIYNALVTGVLARLDGGELIEPQEGAVLVTRLQQVASGYVVDGDGQVHDIVEARDNPRIQVLLAELREVPGKAIVWCRFRNDIVRVLAALKEARIDAVDYYGATKPRDRVRNEERFRSDPKCRVMVSQPQAGGQGLDFSSAQDIFWFSHMHGDLLKRKQADERATRVGGRRIFVTDLVAVGSTDERMLEDLEQKAQRADDLTGEGLRRFLRLVR